MGYTMKEKRKYARKLRRNQTAAEKHLWPLVLFGFRRQRITPSGYIADFYTTYVCVELDGGPHYTRVGRASDRARDKHHIKKGIITIRINNHKALNHRLLVIIEVVGIAIAWTIFQWVRLLIP